MTGTKDEIDWSHVLPSSKWMARDKSGTVFFYAEKPLVGETEWYGPMNFWTNALGFASYKRGTCDWKDSLVKRPD